MAGRSALVAAETVAAAGRRRPMTLHSYPEDAPIPTRRDRRREDTKSERSASHGVRSCTISVQGRLSRARDNRRSFVTQARRSGLPESVVARFSGHRTPAVFKRYNIVEEQDLKAAVQVLNRAREAAKSAAAADGHESDTVDQR